METVDTGKRNDDYIAEDMGDYTVLNSKYLLTEFDKRFNDRQLHGNDLE
jgi:hypothetical protein